MYQKIMVPLDGSEMAECVLAHVASIAGGCRAGGVVFVRVVEPFIIPARGPGFTFTDEEVKEIDAQNQKRAADYLKQVASRVKPEGVKVETEVIMGNVTKSLADYATKNGADLIIIATHGRSGVSRWVWGSVADRILRSACVPVLMVRAPGCVPGI
jgi:nucleotide-binding universal stress UspA family protein